jgi:hypothetical protein
MLNTSEDMVSALYACEGVGAPVFSRFVTPKETRLAVVITRFFAIKA